MVDQRQRKPVRDGAEVGAEEGRDNKRVCEELLRALVLVGQRREEDVHRGRVLRARGGADVGADAAQRAGRDEELPDVELEQIAHAGEHRCEVVGLQAAAALQALGVDDDLVVRAVQVEARVGGGAVREGRERRVERQLHVLPVEGVVGVEAARDARARVVVVTIIIHHIVVCIVIVIWIRKHW